MLQPFLIIACIRTALSIPERRHRTANDFPGIDPEKFEAWHEADLKYARGFPAIAIGGLIAQILASLVASYVYSWRFPNATDDALKAVGMGCSLVIFLISIGWIHTLYSRSAELKKQAGIQLDGKNDNADSKTNPPTDIKSNTPRNN